MVLVPQHFVSPNISFYFELPWNLMVLYFLFTDKVSGSGKEWAYGVKGIPIPYTIELRDKGEYGFILPPEMILPVAKEVLDGFVGMISAAKEINIV